MDSKRRIEAVHRVQAYIERHLHEPITLVQLAKAAELSPWHMSRLFKEVTGKSPFEYIRAFRLSQAAARVSTGEAKIIDIAFHFLFDSHEGFTRAFSRRFGMTPTQFRKCRPQAQLFHPPRARELELSRLKGAEYMPKREKSPGAAQTVFIQVVERAARKLVVKRGVAAKNYYEYCGEVGCEVWDALSGIEAAIHEPMGMWMPEKLRPAGTSEYVQGVELPLDFDGPLPEGFEVIELGPCQLMVFQGEPFDDEDFEDAIGNLRQAIGRHDPASNGFQWADADAPRFQLIPLGYRGYIEGRPVRPIE